MNLEFISANSCGRHVNEFLQHMGDLQNISFNKGQSFIDVIDSLKTRNKDSEEKISAIEEWLKLNIEANSMSAQDVFGIEDGCATFNFRKENK